MREPNEGDVRWCSYCFGCHKWDEPCLFPDTADRIDSIPFGSEKGR